MEFFFIIAGALLGIFFFYLLIKSAVRNGIVEADEITAKKRAEQSTNAVANKP